MNDVLVNVANGIGKKVGELMSMVDMMEIDPGQADFSRMRSLLSDVGDNAIFLTKELKQKDVEIIHVHQFDFPTGPAAASTSRQNAGIDASLELDETRG